MEKKQEEQTNSRKNIHNQIAEPMKDGPEAKKEEAKKQEEVKKEEEKKSEVKKEEVKTYEQGIPVSQFVKKELIEELKTFGFSDNVSAKALYLTGSVSIDKALEWIEKHQADPDYQEELRIVG